MKQWINRAKSARAVVKNEGGFVRAVHHDLMIVVSVLVIFAAIAIPQYQKYKMSNYDDKTKSNLKELDTACKAYWSASGTDQPCNVAMISQAPYG